LANDHYFNSIKQIRVTELLDTGAPDPSATAKTASNPKELSVSYVYEEGEEKTQRGGDVLVCTITEEDTFKGADLDLTIANLDYDVKQAICGGSLKTSGPDTIGWESSSTMPGPFLLEVWVPKYDCASSVEGMEDGYLKLTYNYCKGRLADRSHADREFGEDKFSIKARQNPFSGDPAEELEEVADIT